MNRSAASLMLYLRNLTFVMTLISGGFACGGASDGGTREADGGVVNDGGGNGGGDAGGPNAGAAVITTQPADQSVAEGATATFAVSASNATGYQWQRNGEGDATFSNVSGATAASYTTPATLLSDSGTQYRVIVIGVSNSVTSSVATLTVSSDGGGPVPGAAVITAQPADQSVEEGATASFTVVATATTGYQWQSRKQNVATFSDVSGATAASYTTPVTLLSDSGTLYRVLVTGVSNSVESAAATLTVTKGPDLPPDPASVAPALDPTLGTDILSATEFLYTGANPIQTGVAANSIDASRVAVLRGKALNRSEAPLSGVKVSVLDHPELGQTLSRADGMFDLAVNGGGTLTLRYEKTGFLSAQRAIVAPWRDYAAMPDVVLVPLDSAVTTIDLSASTAQVARGSVVTDADGTRRATVLIPAGTTASMLLPGGSSVPLTTLNMRATEFTVGANGPKAMPASLPPTSGYTYAAELSIDEAMAAGASEVRFNQALPVYLENFLGFPVGSAVPSGYYDRQTAQWVASANGRVIQVVSITDSRADLDIDGDGVVDDSTKLAALKITDDERTRLAQLYTASQTLWRVPVTHFTPWDFNWPFGPPRDAVPPTLRKRKRPKLKKPEKLCGSVIGCEDQTLGESVPVSGTPFTLHYQSERTPGHKDGLAIPLSGPVIPQSLRSIELEVTIAGKIFKQSFGAAPNLTHTIAWDGTDAYGRPLSDSQVASVRVGYTYRGVYMLPTAIADAAAASTLFGHFSYLGAPATGDKERLEVTLWQQYETKLERWDNRSLGLGGFSLSVHHAYDPASQTLMLGNGQQRHAEALASIISTVVGTGVQGFSGDGGPASLAQVESVTDVAVAPDGSLYFADPNNHRVRRISPAGIISTVAGNGSYQYSGDGGSALNAGFEYAEKVALGLDGSLLIADNGAYRIRRVGLDGIVRSIAGTGGSTYGGNGGQAANVSIDRVFDLEMASDGTLYFVNSFEDQIHRISSNGMMTSVAGVWDVNGYSGDGGPALAAKMFKPQGLAIAPDGSLYIADTANCRVRRVSPEGIISTYAGTGEDGTIGDGGPATEAELSRPINLVVGADGTLYIAHESDARIRTVAPDGIITTLAGTGTFGFSGDGGPATAAKIGTIAGMAISPDGILYLADSDSDRLRRIAPLFPKFATTDILLASEDGREIYIFNSRHRHLRTLDALTGGVRYEFNYGSDGYLTSIADGSGNITDIERIGAEPSAIVAPGGQRTELALDANRWLQGVMNPEGEAYAMMYSNDGLLQTFTDPRGNLHRFTYNNVGRLVKDEDPEGGSTTLVRTELANGHSIETTSALGRSRVYQVEQLSAGSVRRTVTAASGATTVTLLNTNGSEQTTYADGSTRTVTYSPDPRWGMLSAVPGTAVTQTPAGRKRTMVSTRTALLTDKDDLLSLTRLADTITDNGAASSLVYEENGATRTLTYTTPTGRSNTVRLDDLGRVIQGQVSGLDPITYAYDTKGMLITLTEGSGAAGRDTNLYYDANYELTSLSDALGRTLGLSYDNAGRPVSFTLPDTRVIALSYDASGNVDSVTPPAGSVHQLNYSSLDQVASYAPPSLGSGSTTTSYGYDDDRALTSVTRPDGKLVALSYDAAGRPSTLGIARGSHSYAFSDTTDQLTGVTAPGGLNLSYTYDGPLLIGVAWSGAVAGSTSYTYNNDLRVSAENVVGAGSVSFVYDADGLLTAAGTMTVTRNAQNGLLTGSTLGSVSDTRTYNALGEPASYGASYNASAIYGTVYTRDDLGRVTQLVETLGGTTVTYAYGYDLAGRLTNVTKDAAPFGTYAYNNNGSRSASNGVSATYDAQDRLLSHGSATYAYTASGELLSKSEGAQTTDYEYDALGNLVAVTLPDGTDIEYVIDGEQRRIGKKVDGSLVQGFLYRGQLRVIAELDGSNNVISRFVYGTQVNVPDYMIRGGTSYRILSDKLGSPRLVVDVGTGAIVQRIDYDAFGQVLSDTNPGFQPFGFAGGLYDRDTKLTRFGARDYDAAVGRWTAKDPIGFAGNDTNLYAYVHGDPVNFIDIDGLSGGDICKPLYIRSKDTRVLDAPVLGSLQQNGLLQPGAVVNFKGFDPSGQFAHIETILPDGTALDGFVLKQNLSTQPPSTDYGAPGQPMSPQAYPSHGAGTKG